MYMYPMSKFGLRERGNYLINEREQ
jgi:hypothetical protein